MSTGIYICFSNLMISVSTDAHRRKATGKKMTRSYIPYPDQTNPGYSTNIKRTRDRSRKEIIFLTPRLLEVLLFMLNIKNSLKLMGPNSL